ncbi:MAG: polysaccharide biosynthesis tyrosine autokinase, partial [Planctomycetota bacterium]
PSARHLSLLRNALFEARLEFDVQGTIFTEKHPVMRMIKARATGLKKLIREQQDTVFDERQQHSFQQTQVLKEKNMILDLERELFEDRRMQLEKRLLMLGSKRIEYVPKEVANEDALEHLRFLRELEEEARWLGEGRLGTVVVYDPAVGYTPVNVGGTGFAPLVLTILLAFVFALGCIYLIEYLDTRIKDDHDVRRHMDLPLLGVIPKENSIDRVICDGTHKGTVPERFNTVAALLQNLSGKLGVKALMVCSAEAREGKTTISVNLAMALARKGARVVLVDGDLRISQVHNVLRLPNDAGLSTLLDTHVDPQQLLDGVLTAEELEGRQPSALDLLQQGPLENLYVLTSGPPSPDPVRLLDSRRLRHIVAEFKEYYDFVIFDTPPVNKVGDALCISEAVDGTIFVVGCSQVERRDVAWAKHLLSNIRCNFLGVLLNKSIHKLPSDYTYYDSKGGRHHSRVRA